MRYKEESIMKKWIAVILTVLVVASAASVAAATNVPQEKAVTSYWENDLWELPEKGVNW